MFFTAVAVPCLGGGRYTHTHTITTEREREKEIPPCCVGSSQLGLKITKFRSVDPFPSKWTRRKENKWVANAATTAAAILMMMYTQTIFILFVIICLNGDIFFLFFLFCTCNHRRQMVLMVRRHATSRFAGQSGRFRLLCLCRDTLLSFLMKSLREMTWIADRSSVNHRLSNWRRINDSHGQMMGLRLSTINFSLFVIIALDFQEGDRAGALKAPIWFSVSNDVTDFSVVGREEKNKIGTGDSGERKLSYILSELDTKERKKGSLSLEDWWAQGARESRTGERKFHKTFSVGWVLSLSLFLSYYFHFYYLSSSSSSSA